MGKYQTMLKLFFSVQEGCERCVFETPISREREISPSARGGSSVIDESLCKFWWPKNTLVLLTHRRKLSNQILMRRVCGRVDLPLVIELLHLGRWPPIINPSHLPRLSKPCNNVFQTLLVLATYLSRFLCLLSLTSSWSRGVL